MSGRKTKNWWVAFGLLSVLPGAFSIDGRDEITIACAAFIKDAARVRQNAELLNTYANHPRFQQRIKYWRDVFGLLGRIPARVWEKWSHDLMEVAGADLAVRRENHSLDVVPPDFYLSRRSISEGLESAETFSPIEQKILLGYLEGQLPSQKPLKIYDAQALVPNAERRRRIVGQLSQLQDNDVLLNRVFSPLKKTAGAFSLSEANEKGEAPSRQARRLAAPKRLGSFDFERIVRYLEKGIQNLPSGEYTFRELVAEMAKISGRGVEDLMELWGAKRGLGIPASVASGYAVLVLEVFGVSETDWELGGIDDYTSAAAADELSSLIDDCAEHAKAQRRKRK